MRVGRTSIGSRIISMLLVICMVFGMVPLSAFAADSASATTVASVEEVRAYAASLLKDSYGNAGTNSDLSWTTETGKGDNWRYYTGVMMDAMLMLGVNSDNDVTNSKGNALEFAQIYMDFNISDSGTINKWHSGELDSVPPALTLLSILDSVGVDEAHREDYETAIHFVYNEIMDQTDYEDCGGNFKHKESGWDTWNIGLDGIYMAQPFLVKYANALASGKITNKNADPNTIYKQVYDRLIWVADNMYDSTTGLYHHGWCVAEEEGNGVFWSRGIGWYAAGLIMCIDMMPDGAYRDGLIKKLPKLFDGMLQYQDTEDAVAAIKVDDTYTGLWYNIVNTAEKAYTKDEYKNNYNRLETSGSGLMAYALMKAYSEGWVEDAKYGEAGLAAFNGITEHKLKNGVLSDIYKQSGVETTQNGYCKYAYVDDEAKGSGGVLMAASVALAAADKLNGTSNDAEVFTIGVVNAPNITIALGSTPDYTGVTATVVSNKGTVKNVDSSKLTFYEYATAAVGDTAGEVTVAVAYENELIDTFTVTVVDSSVPAEGEGTLGIVTGEVTVPSNPSFTTGDWVSVSTGGDGAGFVLTTNLQAGVPYIFTKDIGSNSVNGAGYSSGEIAGLTVKGTKEATDGVYTLSVDSGSLIYWYVDSENRIYTVDGNTNYYLRLTGRSSNNIELTTTASEASEFNFSVSSSKIQLTDSVYGRNAHIYSGGFTNASSGTSNTVYAFTPQAAGDPTYAQLTGTEGFVYPFGVAFSDIIDDIKASTAFKVLVADNEEGTGYTEVAMSDSLVTVEKNSDYKDNEEKTNNFVVKYDGVQIATIPVVVYDDSGSTTNYPISLSVKPGAVVANMGDGTTQLNATVIVEGLDGTGWSVKYSGGSNSVATVTEDGLVTIVGEGSTTITATVIAITYGGATYDSDDFGTITATIPVVVNAEAEVEPPTYELSGVTVTPTTIEAGQTAQVNAYVKASNNIEKPYTFTYQIVSGGDYATISSNGLVTAKDGVTGNSNTVTVQVTLAQVNGDGSFAVTEGGKTVLTVNLTVTEATEEPSEPTSTPTSEPSEEPSTETTAPAGENGYQIATSIVNGAKYFINNGGDTDRVASWVNNAWATCTITKSEIGTVIGTTYDPTVTVGEITLWTWESVTDTTGYFYIVDEDGNKLYLTEKSGSSTMTVGESGELFTVSITADTTNVTDTKISFVDDGGDTDYLKVEKETGGISGKTGNSSAKCYLYTPVNVNSSCDHSYTSEVTKDPTCTAAGETTYTCSKCGDSYTEVIPATGHTNAAAVEENRKNATCTEAGSYDLVVYCSVCGTKVSSETKTIDALGHNYVDGECTVCGEADPDYSEPSEPTTPSTPSDVPEVSADTVYEKLTALNADITYVVLASGNYTATHGTDPGVINGSWTEATGGWKYSTTAQLWAIEKISGSSNYYIYYVDGNNTYYLNGTGTDNYPITSATKDTQWAITFTDTTANLSIASGTVGNASDRVNLKIEKDNGPKLETSAQAMALYAPVDDSSDPETATPSSLAVTSDKTITVANGATLDLSGVTATVTMSNGSTKAATGLTFEHSVNTSEAGNYTVTVKYTENGVTVSDTFTVTVEAAEVTPPVSSEKYIHNFSEHGFTDEDKFFAIKGSEKTSGVSTITYNGISLSRALKMNSSAEVSFTADADGKLILVFAGSANNVDVTVDGTTTRYTRDSNYTVTVEGISNGDKVVVDYGSGESSLYYVEFVPTGAGTAYPASATVSPSKVNVPNSGTVDLSSVTMEVTMSDGSKKTIQNADLTYDISGINTAVAKEHTVPVSYTEGGKTVTANVTVVVAAPSAGTETSDLWKHNFSVDGATDADNFFSIKGNTTSKSGSYGDLKFDTALKIESSTDISFTAPNEGTLTLVLESSGKDIKINGTSYTSGSGGIVTVDVAAGKVEIAKDDSTTLFYMEYASAVTDGIKITAPGTLYIAGEAGWSNAAPTHTLQYTVRHNEEDITSGYTIEWSSLDSSVVQVNKDGVITGLKSGTTSVTAKVTVDGEEYTDTVQVTVVGPGVSATEEMELILGETGKDSGNITSTVYAGGSTTNDYTLGYFSSNENVATVDANGVVTAQGKGEATIYTYVTHVNGYQIYSGTPSVDAIPNIYDTTKVTVTAKEVVDAHLNSYDYVIHTVTDPKDDTNLINALTYKPSVGVEGGVTAEKGLILTIEFNTGDKKTIHFKDPGLTVDYSNVDFSDPTIQTALVTYVDPETGEELFRDTIWIHVEDLDLSEYDGIVTYEDGIHFILDTDGINVNKEYAIVPGSANNVALRNPSINATNSGAAGSTSVTLAHGDVVTKLNNSGNVIYSDVDYLTMNEHDVEYTSWLLDTFVENVVCADGVTRTQMNASSLLRYLGGGDSMTQLIHANVGHVYLETVSVVDGEYRIVLGFGLNDQPYYLGYESGVWTATTEPSSVYLYYKHIEMIQDYGVNYDLTPVELSIPEGFVADPIIPSVVFNKVDNVPSEWYTIVWSSTNEKVATVDQNGVVTAISPGSATISATLYDVYGMTVICTTHNVESITKTVEVEVTSSNPTPVLDPDEMTIGVGTMPNFSKIAVKMTFPGTNGEYDYDVPFDQLNFKLADATGTADDGTKMDRFDNTVPGTYIVPVSYAGQDFELTIHVVEDPYAGLEEADSIPGFPDAGSVRMNKTAKGVLDFTQTGVTKLELTAAGVSTKNSVDVVLIVDVSNSMGWTTTWFDGMSASQVEDATDSQKIPTGGAGTGTDKLALAMATADDFADILLNVDGGDNTITFVTFAGADRDHGGSSDYVDSVRTPMVGISDYTTASKVFADTKFTTLAKDGTGASYKLQIGGYTEDIDGKTYGEAKVSGTNRGNTNYDYAFGEAIDAVNQLKAKYAANNNGKRYEDSGRQIHVVFMTDGAPSHYNDQRGNGNAKDTLWDGSGDNYKDVANNNEANWLAYIKNYNELANQLLPMIDGAYTVGFDMAHGGFGDYSYGLDDMQRVLEGLAKNTIVPVTMADDEDELNDYFTSLARALAYAGTNAQVTDVIGGSFSLFTGTSMYSSDITAGGIMSEETLAAMQAMSFPITINSYRLVTVSDLGTKNASLIDTDGDELTVDEITEAHLGLRFNEAPEILEQITFNAAGTEAYSSLNPGVNIMTTDTAKGQRVIDAETFTYTATLDTLIHEGVETVHAKDETINWKIGTITDKEVAMEYYAYLDGSLDNPREAVAGVYATNEYAYAEYVDVYGKYVKRYYGVPQIAWGAGNVTVRFFLVNENGQYVNRAGVTFTNPANRIFLDGRAYYEAELNNSVSFTALDALAQAGLAGTNILYDVKAGATVTNSTTAGQGGVAWVMDNSLNNIENLLTYVDSSNGFHSSVVIDIPVIMTDKGESLRPMAETTVVIDYGKPMDINVFSVEEAPIATNGYVSVRNPDDGSGEHLYKMEIVGFAAYSASHDLRDYVDARNITYTTYGEESTYFKTSNGKYVVISSNGETQVRFIPTTILDEVEQVFVAVKFQEYSMDGTTATDQYYYMFKQLNIIPATVVYYETDGNMGGAFSYSKDGWTLESEPNNVATESQNAYTSGGIYGNDSSYDGDTMYSNGSSYVAAGTYVRDSEGNITHPVSTSFTFTGTGFDIIGRTGKDQGSIKVTIVNNKTGESQTISAICKGQEELYQVPVLSVNTLKYGTYTVTVTVLQGATYTTNSSSPLYQLNMGNQFVFDAVRIFGTLTGAETIQSGTMNNKNEYTTSEFTVESIYAADGEANVYFEEVRDQLIDAKSFGTDGDTTGIMYMDDYNGTVDITNYELYGANDEVYLKRGNVIAFSFELSQAHTSFDLGMKSADSNEVKAEIAIVANGQTYKKDTPLTINTSTAQFYDLLAETGYTVGNGTIHVVIKNVGESGILSLTDLKVAGSTAPVVLKASAETLDAARFATDKGLDVLGAGFGTDSVRVARSATMQVITEANVESLKITNAYGEEVWFSAVSTEVGGQLIWTVVLRPTLLGDQSFTITGFNADGEYGQSQSAVVSVELY